MPTKRLAKDEQPVHLLELHGRPKGALRQGLAPVEGLARVRELERVKLYEPRSGDMAPAATSSTRLSTEPGAAGSGETSSKYCFRGRVIVMQNQLYGATEELFDPLCASRGKPHR